MSRKKMMVSTYITPEQDAALKRLSEATHVPVAVYIREGVDSVLEKHRTEAKAAHPFLATYPVAK